MRTSNSYHMNAKERREAEKRHYYAHTKHSFFPPAVTPMGEPVICLLCGLIEDRRFERQDGSSFAIHVVKKKADEPFIF